MEKAVMQPRWIQRLNPTCQTGAYADEEPTKPSHSWTHFTKDFSSSSEWLHKARHHTRSSSWPPNERTAKFYPSPNLKVVDPIEIKEQYLLSRATMPMFREEHLNVPASDSNDFCSKTGNLFSNQYTSLMTGSSLEELVPCSPAPRTCDDFHEDNSRNEGIIKDSFSQQFKWLFKESASAVDDSTLLIRSFINANLNKESRSLCGVGSARVLGDAPYEEGFAVSDLAHRMVHIRGSSPDADIRTSISTAHRGASADADDRMQLSPAHIKDVYPSTPFKSSSNRPAVVYGDAESRVIKDHLVEAPKKTSGTVTSKEAKTGLNFGFLRFVRQSEMPNQSPATPCVCGVSCNGQCSDQVGVYNRAPASISIQKKQNAAVGAFALVRPLVTKELYDLQAFNTYSRRDDPIVADHLHNLEEEMRTKMSLERLPSGELTRPSSKETNLDDYWVKLLTDFGLETLPDTSFLKANPPRELMTNEYHMFGTANIQKPDEKEKHTLFGRSGPHLPVYANAQTIYSCDLPQQTKTSLCSNFILGGSSTLRTLQGGTRRLMSQTDRKEHKLCADARTPEYSRPDQAWIQRWCSSSNVIAMSAGKTLSSFVGMDNELGSDSTMLPPITSYKEKKDRDNFGCNLIEPARTSKLHMEGSVRHHNSDLGVTRGCSFPVYGRDASLRGRYVVPSVEAMAIVGNTSGNLYSTSLQDRGSFSVWGYPNEKSFQERRHAKEIVDQNFHGVDMDDLEFLVCKMR